VPTYNLIPNQCPKELNYSVKQLDGSNLPVAIWFDSSTVGSEFIGVYEVDENAASVYFIAVTSMD